jgi:hypothetical protein
VPHQVGGPPRRDSCSNSLIAPTFRQTSEATGWSREYECGNSWAMNRGKLPPTQKHLKLYAMTGPAWLITKRRWSWEMRLKP